MFTKSHLLAVLEQPWLCHLHGTITELAEGLPLVPTGEGARTQAEQSLGLSTLEKPDSGRGTETE